MSEYENFLSEFEKLSFKMPNFRGYGPLIAYTGGGAALGMGLAAADPKWKKLSPKKKRRSLATHGLLYGGLGAYAAPKGALFRRWYQEAYRRAGQARGGYQGYQRRHGVSNRSAAKDAMNTLNIGSNVKTKKEAQKLYRKQAMKYHPDRGGDPAKMSEVNKAWEIFQNSSHFQKLAFHEELQKIANLAGGGYFGSTPTARPGAMNPMNTARMANQGAAKIVQPRKPRMAAQKGIGAKAQQASASALAQASNLQPQKFASAKPKKVAKGKHWLYHKKKREVEEAPVSRGRDDEAATSEEEGKPEDNEGVRYDSNAHLAKQSSVRSGRSTELLKIARGAHRANPILNLRKHHKNKKPSDVLRAMANKSRK